MRFIASAITGNYEVVGNPYDVDCIIGQSFGAGPNGDPGRINELLARFAVSVVNYRPDIVQLLQQEIAAAMPADAPEPALVIRGTPSTFLGGELDAWTVLKESKRYMEEHGLERPMLVTSAHLVGRFAVQARKQGMRNIVVPRGLPKGFDPNSTQPHIRSLGAWAGRELPGMAYLWARGRL